MSIWWDNLHSWILHLQPKPLNARDTLVAERFWQNYRKFVIRPYTKKLRTLPRMTCISPNFSCLKRRHMLDACFLSFLVIQQRNLAVIKTTHLKARLNPYLECLFQQKGSSNRQEISEYWSCLRCILLTGNAIHFVQGVKQRWRVQKC